MKFFLATTPEFNHSHRNWCRIRQAYTDHTSMGLAINCVICMIDTAFDNKRRLHDVSMRFQPTKIPPKNDMKSKAILTFAAMSALAATSAQAAIYTFSDFTRTAGGASTTTTHDFSPNEGWSGTPPNTTAGEDSLYLTATVSWAASTNIGTFNVRFNQNDDGGAARLGMGKSTGGSNTGFDFITSNPVTDPDGVGPATARPTIVGVTTTTVTSVTLVMKINHTLSGTSPGGDWWFADSGLQSSALGFMYINPNLAAPESGQFTPWAAWRSGNASYSGVSFITDTDAVDLNFTNIALYTGTDTPFSLVPEPSAALLGGLGFLALLRRRR